MSRRKDDSDKEVSRMHKISQERAEEAKEMYPEFAKMLKRMGLMIRDIKSEGNCCFRSLADQHSGNEGEHMKIRLGCVDYMRRHPEDFSPFVTGNFEKYLSNMEKYGVWGGHLELLAASRYLNAHIVIHQLNTPRFEILHSAPNKDTRIFHLGYHDGNHYTSIRLEGDNIFMPPSPIKLGLTSSTPEAQSAVDKVKKMSPLDRNTIIVMETTRCKAKHFVRQLLKDVDNDIDAAVQIVFTEMLRREIPEDEGAPPPGQGEGGEGEEKGGSGSGSGEKEGGGGDGDGWNDPRGKKEAVSGLTRKEKRALKLAEEAKIAAEKAEKRRIAREQEEEKLRLNIEKRRQNGHGKGGKDKGGKGNNTNNISNNSHNNKDKNKDKDKGKKGKKGKKDGEGSSDDEGDGGKTGGEIDLAVVDKLGAIAI